MGKLRIHELARKLNMSNQELITKLAAKGLSVKTHSSTVDEAEAMALLTGNIGTESGTRPRTVLRRRREAEEAVAAPVEIAVAPGISATPELGANVEEATPAIPAVPESIPSALKDLTREEESGAKEPAAAAEPLMAESEPTLHRTPSEQVTTPKFEPEQPTVKSEPVQMTPPPPVSGAETAPATPQRVIRIIDAEAIRQRLAAEGRSFRRPAQRPQQGSAGSGSFFPRVREIQVGPDTSGPGGPFGQAGARPAQTTAQAPSAGSRSSSRKKGGREDAQDRDRKEAKSGGYELWLSPGRKKKQTRLTGKTTKITQAAAHKRIVELSGPITVNDLAHRMSIKAGQVVTKLMGMGMMVTVNQPIDTDTATIIASEFGFEVKNVGIEEKDLIKTEVDPEGSRQPRAPVVTIMGHVDHGKTSILDALRETNVAAGEAGGITQHIGAYSVETPRGKITVLDTPGHEAFTQMRARGADVTDIVVLVVAANDGVMPQTIEAIHHAKAAKVPVVVAVNKIDLPDAKPERVLQQLSEHGLVPEEWGGDVQVFKVSALKKIGLGELVDGIVTLAEVNELSANPDKKAEGAVIEAKLDKGRGPVATILVQNGTLRQGDYVVAGEFSGRVRAIYDSNAKQLSEAGPSSAVLVLGLDGVPMAGDRFNVMADDHAAKVVAQFRAQKYREIELLKTSRVSLENFLKSSPKDTEHFLRLIVKADAYGSAEALNDALKGLSTKEVKVDIVHSGVGTITESDVNLAVASKAIIIGFNTKPDAKAQALAMQERVDIRSYSVIYAVLDEVRLAMAGLLAPVIEEVYLGKAEVRAIFPVTKAGNIAGCYVLDGKIVRSARVRVRRGKEIIFEGNIGSLRRFKDDVKEVLAGYECGIGVEGFSTLTTGDVLECFDTKQVAAKLGATLREEEARAKKVESEEGAQAFAG
jgi:translation initiation factor IF-2